MIDVVLQKLNETDKKCCISPTLHCQESDKSVNLDPRGDAIKIKVDGCLNKETLRLIAKFLSALQSKRYVFLVE